MNDPENEAPEWMLDINEKIQEADGFIVVSGELNCAISPTLSNMLDYFPPSSFRHRPCGIVSYSISKKHKIFCGKNFNCIEFEEI